MIVKYEHTKPISPRLPEAQSQIVNASYSQPLAMALKDQNLKDQIRDYLKIAVSQAKVRGGFKIETWNNHDLTQFLNDCLRVMAMHGWIGINEIEIIFFNGMLGNYGENYGLNLEAVNRWFKAYCEEDRRKAMNEQVRYLKELEKKQDELKVEQLRKESYDRSKEAIEAMKGTDPGQDLLKNPIYYDYLEANKLININTSEKKKVYQKALKSILDSKDPITKELVKKEGYAHRMAVSMSKDELFRNYIKQK